MPPLHARPRHAAPRNHGKVRAALVPAVLLASSGSALGGLAVSASADDRAPRVTSVASTVDLRAAQSDRTQQLATAAARADRTRSQADVDVAQQQVAAQAAAAAAEQARTAAEKTAADQAAAQSAQAAAAAAAPKYVRPDVGPLSSPFGMRWGHLHAGIDLAGPWGSTVVAVADGVVESTQDEGGYGNCLRLQHPDGTETLYGHLSSFLVTPGTQVQAGQPIAREGNSGHSTGAHLHFEVHIGGTAINPIGWLQAHGIAV